jgi:branched-chain amino acid transport system ATP-binding protein
MSRGILIFGGRSKKNSEANELAEKTAVRIGLMNKMETGVSDLSHGERRQLELGLAIAGTPALVMFDELCSGLSTNERHTMVELIRLLDKDVTLILIEHDMDVAFAVADIVTVMYEGRVLVEGTPDEIRSNVQVQQIYLGGDVSGVATNLAS